MNRDEVIRMAREAGYYLYDLTETHGTKTVETDEADEWAQLERFAALVAAKEREACGKARAGKPRELPSIGLGSLHSEQQFCFEKGFREGAAAVRAAIRARGQKEGA